jgi:resuscitation-promoting factor RpfA
LRPTSAAAAAPNSSTIGGAGTGAGVPLDDPVEPLDDALDDEAELDDDDELLALVEKPLEVDQP